MKQKIFTLLIVIVIAGIVGCSYSDTATVTIDLGIYKQAKLSLFDRVLAWLALSTPVTAYQPPNISFSTLQVKVTAPDMETMSQEFEWNEIIANNGTITLTVPAGAQRTFEIVAGNDEKSRIYGGVKTVDLTPGEVNLSIEVGMLVILVDSWGYTSVEWGNNQILITYYFSILINDNTENNGPEPLYFKVYKKNVGNASPTYQLIDTVDARSLTSERQNDYITYSYSNQSIDSYNYYQFWISAVNQYGEGEKQYMIY